MLYPVSAENKEITTKFINTIISTYDEMVGIVQMDGMILKLCKMNEGFKQRIVIAHFSS